MEKIILFRQSRNHGVGISCSEESFRRLEKLKLPGCPFDDYYALDLVRDLIAMYGWMIEAGNSYDLADFLDICGNNKAVTYKQLIVG